MDGSEGPQRVRATTRLELGVSTALYTPHLFEALRLQLLYALFLFVVTRPREPRGVARRRAHSCKDACESRAPRNR
jgi:hypothetical protein